MLQVIWRLETSPMLRLRNTKLRGLVTNILIGRLRICQHGKARENENHMINQMQLSGGHALAQPT